MTASHKFTVTLSRPQGARVFKGTADDAFEDDVTSLKIAITPPRKSKS